MKKIIIIIIIQLITTLVLAEEPKTVDEFFAQIYSNQSTVPLFYKELSKEENKQIYKENQRKKENRRKLVSQLSEIAKTNNTITHRIIDEMINHTIPNLGYSNRVEVIREWGYRMSLLDSLRNSGPYAVLDCANKMLELTLYTDVHNIANSLGLYWRTGKLKKEEVQPILIAFADEKIENAVKVLLGDSISRITRKALDKDAGERIVREWIEQATNNKQRLKYYQLLRTANIDSQEQINDIKSNILKSRINNPNFPVRLRLSSAEELLEINTNDPETQKIVKELKVEKEEYDKKLKKQIEKQEEIKKNYNPTNVLEFFVMQLEYVKNNNITNLEIFIKQLPDFKQQYNITNFVGLIILESQQGNINMKRCMTMHSATNIIQLLEKQLEEAKKYPDPFKEKTFKRF